MEQTRPGGRVVTPWGTAYLNGALLALTVGEDNTATGRLVDNVAFMWLRDQPGVFTPIFMIMVREVSGQ